MQVQEFNIWRFIGFINCLMLKGFNSKTINRLAEDILKRRN